METRSFTYAELAKALGITAASAKRLATRHRWSKAVGNDGKSRVQVPLEYLDRPAPPAAADDPADAAQDTAGDDTGARAVVAMLEARVHELQGELQELRPLATRAAVSEALLEAERARLEELRADRDRWHEAATARPPGIVERLRRAFG